MIIVRRTWRDIPDGALVVDPAGRIWHLLGKFTDNMGRPYASLTDPEDPIDGAQVSPHVDVNAAVETITHDSTLEHAVGILSGSFALERI